MGMRALLGRKVGLEATLQDLETRRAGVVRRLEAAAMRAEETFAAQRTFLTETNGENASEAKRLAEAARRVTDERAALQDAADVLAGQIDAAKKAIDIERDRKARTEVAGEIEAGAAAIEAAAVELDRAAAAFDLARERLIDACAAHAPRDVVTGGSPAFNIVTSAARRAGIADRYPDVTALYGAFYVDATQAAAVTVDAMLTHAKAIRQGATPLLVPQKPSLPLMPVTYPMARVCLAQPAFYRGFLGHRIDLFPGNVEAPESAVQAAIAKGIGFTPTSAAGQLIMRTIKMEPNARFEVDGSGAVRVVKSTGELGEGGKGLPPAPAPVDLGTMPDTLSVTAEAAQ